MHVEGARSTAGVLSGRQCSRHWIWSETALRSRSLTALLQSGEYREVKH